MEARLFTVSPLGLQLKTRERVWQIRAAETAQTG
jgi:hypothetical protein